MRKILVSSTIYLVLFFGGARFAIADDVGPNPVFWMTGQKPVNCVSIINPGGSGDNYFYVFDYSKKIGASLGRPWSIMEKGKCYQFDPNDPDNDIYRVQDVTGDERGKFENTNNLDPAANLNEDKNDSIERIHFIPDMVTVTYRMGPGIELSQFLPTKYNFPTWESSSQAYIVSELSNQGSPNPPVDAIGSSGGDYPYGNDDYIKASKLYTTLALELNKTLNSCDTRIRIEYQLKNETDYSIIWQLNNKQEINVDHIVPKHNSGYFSHNWAIDQLAGIDYLGCKIAFSQFIKDHQNDFSNIDFLAEQTLKLKKDPRNRIGNNDEKSINKILAFAFAGIVPANPAVVPTPEQSDANTGATPADNSAAATSEQSDAQQRSDFYKSINFTPITKPTTLEQPTAAKKMDLLTRSSNPLIWFYILLPIVALIGIVLFLFVFLKKRPK